MVAARAAARASSGHVPRALGPVYTGAPPRLAQRERLLGQFSEYVEHFRVRVLWQFRLRDLDELMEFFCHLDPQWTSGFGRRCWRVQERDRSLNKLGCYALQFRHLSPLPGKV